MTFTKTENYNDEAALEEVLKLNGFDLTAKQFKDLTSYLFTVFRVGPAVEYEPIICEDPEEKKKFIAEKEAEYKDLFASPYQAANRGYIDDVIEPRTTRARIINAFEKLQTKRLTNPAKKHCNLPL